MLKIKMLIIMVSLAAVSGCYEFSKGAGSVITIGNGNTARKQPRERAVLATVESPRGQETLIVTSHQFSPLLDQKETPVVTVLATQGALLPMAPPAVLDFPFALDPRSFAFKLSRPVSGIESNGEFRPVVSSSSIRTRVSGVVPCWVIQKDVTTGALSCNHALEEALPLDAISEPKFLIDGSYFYIDQKNVQRYSKVQEGKALFYSLVEGVHEFFLEDQGSLFVRRPISGWTVMPAAELKEWDGSSVLKETPIDSDQFIFQLADLNIYSFRLGSMEIPTALHKKGNEKVFGKLYQYVSETESWTPVLGFADSGIRLSRVRLQAEGLEDSLTLVADVEEGPTRMIRTKILRLNLKGISSIDAAPADFDDQDKIFASDSGVLLVHNSLPSGSLGLTLCSQRPSDLVAQSPREETSAGWSCQPLPTTTGSKQIVNAVFHNKTVYASSTEANADGKGWKILSMNPQKDATLWNENETPLKNILDLKLVKVGPTQSEPLEVKSDGLKKI